MRSTRRSACSRPRRPDRTVAEPAAPRQRKQKAAGQTAAERSRLRVGVLPFLAIARRQDESLAFSLEPGNRRRARALPLVRRDRADGADARRRAAPFISEDALRPNELDYVVDGALSRDGDKYQISVRLLDLTQRRDAGVEQTVRAAGRPARPLDERVTAPIVAQIDPVILLHRGPAEARARTTTRSACVLRAIPLLYTHGAREIRGGRPLIEQALEMEPDNAMVLAWAAYWRVYYVGPGLGATIRRRGANVRSTTRSRATQLDPNNAEALGDLRAYLRVPAQGLRHGAALFRPGAASSIRNLPFIWALSALTYCYHRRAREGARSGCERCRELTPFAAVLLLSREPGRDRPHDAAATTRKP